MKQWGILAIAACLVAAGCGSDSPSSPSTTNPTTIVFTAQLRPSNEVPPVSNAESTGTGDVTITMNLTRTSTGAIQSGTVDFRFNLTGFPAGTTVTLGHIHPGAAGANGSPLINIGLSAAAPLVLVNGSGSYEVKGVTAGADAATLQSIIDTPANFYFNVHSTTNPGGVARGQLVKQ
jgi:hypothetical protein